MRTSRVVYWGDLDSDGFAILHSASGTYPTLTASENVSLARIHSEGNVRLEQERIPWEVALGVVRAAIGSAHGAEYLIHPVHEPRG